LRNWAAAEPAWGIWNIAEAQAGVLPTDLKGRDSIELGCGTGYVSAWLARRGARPVGLDNSAAQLATARQLQDRIGLQFPLIHASAEQAPFADASFDLAISEYGASIWCDPYAWIPEAARLLRPGRSAHLPGELGPAHAHPSRTPMTSLPPSGCCGPTSACTGSTGQMMSRWSFTSATAT
jgi:ubiquinone/menaquinone biosynthesis C-methylase UbiE